MSGEWISPGNLKRLAAEGTTAHRVWTGRSAWIERFGDDFLISDPAGHAVNLAELGDWAAAAGLAIGRVFVRKLVKQPGEDDVPLLVRGDQSGDLGAVVLERGLRFSVNFAAGYSVGLFCDQRENRAFLESLNSRRVLNCFAYTCAFSVAAARAGAETLSVDLSKRSLATGRRNFELNGLERSASHRFIADDVFAVLPRLARRGEEFDVIVLDPPTFSRGAGGKVFRAAEGFASLVELGCRVLAEGGRMLLSTNARDLGSSELRQFAAGLSVDRSAPVGGDPLQGCSSFVWVQG